MEVTIQKLGVSVRLVVSDEYTKDGVDPLDILVDMALDTLNNLDRNIEG